MVMCTQSQNTSCFDRMLQCAEGTYIFLGFTKCLTSSLSDDPFRIPLCVLDVWVGAQLMLHKMTMLWDGKLTGIFVT